MTKEFDAEGFLARLKEGFGGVSYERVSSELGVRRQTIYRWGHGHTQPELEKLLIISEKTGCSIHWLLTGEGPKFIESPKVIEALEDDVVVDILLNHIKSILRHRDNKTRIVKPGSNV